MPHQNNFSWTHRNVILQVFFCGLIYFLLTTCYSLLHYKEKFLIDGTALIFHLTNFKRFPPAEQREIIFLQQILPLLSVWAGFKIKWVMMGYIVNVYLLYFLLFALTVLVFKDPLAGLALLLIHYKGDPYNYFMIVEELLPGCCMAIVLLSLLRNVSVFKSRWSFYSLALALLFFVVRSHPMALVSFGGGIVVLFFSDRQLFSDYKREFLVVGSAVAILMGLKFLFLNPYDTLLLKSGKSVFESFKQLCNPDYFFEMVMYLFYARKVFTITFSALAVFLFWSKRYAALSAVLMLVWGCVVLFNTHVTVTDFKLYNIDFMNYDRWSLPIRFIVFTAFCFLFLSRVKSKEVYKMVQLTGAVYFFFGLVQVVEAQELSKAYLTQAENIIQKCRDSGVSKAVVNMKELDGTTPIMNNAYVDIMVLSSLESRDSCIQVVYSSNEDIPEIEQLREDSIVLYQNIVFPEKMVNSAYYKLRPEAYTLLDR
jgi:hypothetical protein